MKSKTLYGYCASALLVGLLGAQPAGAASSPTTIAAPIGFNVNACAIYGDFYSCSTQLLEGVLQTPNNTYALPVGPGQLQDNIVIGDNPGSNPVNDLLNSDLFTSTPGGTGVDNGYTTPTGSGTFDFSTKDGALGGTPDPTAPYPFTPEFTGDLQNSWDISVSNLQTFLNGADLVVGFDHNQTGVGDAQNLLAWALVCFDGGGQPTICFELTNSAVQDPLTFSTGKTLGSDPTEPSAVDPFGTPNDFVVSHGQICTADTLLVQYTSKSDCEKAGGVFADANKGNAIDFLIWSPDINNFLHSPAAALYTTMHVRWDMRQLNDGAETAFILPAVTQQVIPEPESLLLVALGLLGLYVTRRRFVTKR
jgi:hypothetical protein